jgi:hypothetical protein
MKQNFLPIPIGRTVSLEGQTSDVRLQRLEKASEIMILGFKYECKIFFLGTADLDEITKAKKTSSEGGTIL